MGLPKKSNKKGAPIDVALWPALSPFLSSNVLARGFIDDENSTMQDIEPLPSKRPNLSPKPSSSNPGGTFARTTSSGSYREASAVSPELQSQLESIGMRTRFSEFSDASRSCS